MHEAQPIQTAVFNGTEHSTASREFAGNSDTDITANAKTGVEMYYITCSAWQTMSNQLLGQQQPECIGC